MEQHQQHEQHEQSQHYNYQCDVPTTASFTTNNNENNEIYPHVNAHFPNILHRLLSSASVGNNKNDDDNDDDDNDRISLAMEWLPHGRGWRVLRWEELPLVVLPQLFPTTATAAAAAATTTTTTMKRNKFSPNDATDNANHHHNHSTNGDNNNKNNNDTKGINHHYDDDHDSSERRKKEWFIDIFLWHVRAFGFVEVTSGLDRGSFCHGVRKKRTIY